MKGRLNLTVLFLLALPAIAWFYIGLFVTIQLWYPHGLTNEQLVQHVGNFSIVYLLWVVIFFIYTLFDIATFRNSATIISRLLAAMLTNGLIATAYFYFQPELILTPRRFLLVHILATTIGLAIWYAMIQIFLPKLWQRQLYFHQGLYDQNLHQEIENYLAQGIPSVWRFGGVFSEQVKLTPSRTTVVLPPSPTLPQDQLQKLYLLKREGVEFLEYHRFVEITQRMVPLSKVSEIWFLRSVDFGRHRVFDIFKRIIDILAGLIGSLILGVILPIVAVAIKLDSNGPVFFVQDRVGRNGKIFRVYKFRTMSGGVTDTWTQEKDSRITKVGKVLRRTRLDELPQMLNILLGNMSLVGPRPEQVGIVASLKQQIPYYDERHIVKPGLTGWSQLHVYANTLEGTKLKLQYDFYYIKHRSMWFDSEIILRTIFHIITLQGK